MVKSAKKPKKESLTPLLQKWHRNEIFKAIQTVGLDPGNFDLSDSGTEVQIKHKSSASCFIVRRESGYYVGQYVVGDASAWPYSPGGWESLMPRVSRWLEEVKRDLETPDLWAEFQREAKLLEAGSNAVTENRPFTPKEQREIAARLQELAKYEKETYPLSPVQTKALDAKLDYLIDASNRLGRKDWLTVFVGAILGYILTAALPPESVHGLLQTSFRVMGLLYPEISSD
ncbi:MAG: hypothetical protein E7813_10340 [Bradyrhizobium sp.]|uniref:hypothetical protein n=1 Tax=Bradyrhizobium sp. TaxID=376 RepID=UPI0011F794DD|nr:hypothetical protein [Bradyrhizobium sp.]THD68420.1 MAG: hypothetical protein E7813_10340 [Bradyrhizobium sp.]